jgi:hypothetical protein
MSIVALLSAVETPSLTWIFRSIWSLLWALHTLDTSSTSLEDIGVLDHLTLWNCIALPNWLGPLLKLWLGRTENMHGRRRSNALARSVALLVLAFLFVLALHHSSMVFQEKSFAYHSLRILKVTSF